MQPKLDGAGILNDTSNSPPQTIVMGGSVWKLRRDATDATAVFPHIRVGWLESGCEFIADDHDYFVWIRGVIEPKEGSIEKPLNVMYVGFHPEKISVKPNTIYETDINRMHIYVNDASGFALEFCNNFLGTDKPETREGVKPYPSKRKAIKDAELKGAAGDETNTDSAVQ